MPSLEILVSKLRQVPLPTLGVKREHLRVPRRAVGMHEDTCQLGTLTYLYI